MGAVTMRRSVAEPVPAPTRGADSGGAGAVVRRQRAAGRGRARDLWHLTFALAAIAATAGAVRSLGLRIQHTASLPVGVYRMVPGTPDRGTIGLWCLPRATAMAGRQRGYLAAGTCDGGAEPVGKVVLAVAGDTIHYSESGIALNGRAVPNTRPLAYDSRGRPLAHAPFGVYVLPRGAVWLWSPYSSASWDSRYFGPVSRSRLIALATPLWTIRREALALLPTPSSLGGLRK